MYKGRELCWLGILRLTLALNGAAFGEDTPTSKTAPAELQRLAWTIGVWDTTATCRFAPDATTFRGRSIETVRWAANRQFLISDQWGLMPSGWENKLVVTTWNPAKREYDLSEINAKGEVVKMTMVIEDGVQKVLCYRPLGDRLVRTELTVEYVSPVQYRFHCDCTDQGKTWRFCEGTSKKRQ